MLVHQRATELVEADRAENRLDLHVTLPLMPASLYRASAALNPARRGAR
jgi:hypothetical protein